MTSTADILRNAGLKKTQARVLVFEALSSGEPRTHEEVVAELHKKGLDRATVYRNLMDLTTAGLAVREDLGDRVWRFELLRDGVEPHRAHPHFICTTCENITCLPKDGVKVLPGLELPADVEVHVRGLCATCATKSARR